MTLTKNKVLFLLCLPVVLFLLALYIPWTCAYIDYLQREAHAPPGIHLTWDDPKENVIPYNIYAPIVGISSHLSLITVPISIIYFLYNKIRKKVVFNKILIGIFLPLYIFYLSLIFFSEPFLCDGNPYEAISWFLD